MFVTHIIGTSSPPLVRGALHKSWEMYRFHTKLNELTKNDQQTEKWCSLNRSFSITHQQCINKFPRTKTNLISEFEYDIHNTDRRTEKNFKHSFYTNTKFVSLSMIIITNFGPLFSCLFGYFHLNRINNGKLKQTTASTAPKLFFSFLCVCVFFCNFTMFQRFVVMATIKYKILNETTHTHTKVYLKRVRNTLTFRFLLELFWILIHRISHHRKLCQVNDS